MDAYTGALGGDNKMGNFKNQIDEDIKYYQQEFSYIKNIEKNEWAFNFWVLDKLFSVDEELIELKIVDYHDLGVDAYEIYEDTKEVYLIQNKYYSENTLLSSEYIKNDFLLRAITALENGTYPKSEELQKFFSKYKLNPDFSVKIQLFITNNNKSEEIDAYIKKFNSEHPKYIAKIFYLNDIESRYYDDIKVEQKNFSTKLESINKGTILNIKNEAYKMANILDARYALTPVVSLYRLYREAIEKGYPIFEKNIREYLGNKGINNNIYKTLLDKEERKNFFYYNNGITIICDKIGPINTVSTNSNLNVVYTIDNPQIVNGCQTVNSIYEALDNIDSKDLEKEFKDTFVMVKILEINRQDLREENLYKNIVRYNNSQNSIDEKTFVANTDIFIRLQTEFEKKGFILLIKQSDLNKYSSKYKTISELQKNASERLTRFNLPNFKKASDSFIKLEKFLQVINAFASGGYIAYVKKSTMLKFGSETYQTAINFIKNGNITNDVLLDLFMLYLKAEQTKKESEDKRSPIPYYLIDCFAKYECKDRKVDFISSELSESSKILHIVKLYKAVSSAYSKDYAKKFSVDYNKMIKQNVNYEILDNLRDTLKDVI